MDRTDAIAGVHRNDDLGNQGHIDDNPITVLNALRPEHVREAAHFCMQLAITQPSRIASFSFEDNGGLVSTLCEMYVETVVGNVQLTVSEPSVVRRLAVVERNREGPVPSELLACEISPELLWIAIRVPAQRLEVGSLQPGTGNEFACRWEGSFLM